MPRGGPPASSSTGCGATTAGCSTPYKDGQAKLDAYLDDYADLIDGLTRLYEATGEPRWIESALELARIMIDEFADREQGGFFFTGRSPRSPDRPAEGRSRQRDALGQRHGRDGLGPAGRLDRPRRPDPGRPQSALESVQVVLEREPAAAGQSLIALDFLLGSDRGVRRDRRLGRRRVPRGPGSRSRRRSCRTRSSPRPHPRRRHARRAKSRCWPIARPVTARPRPISARHFACREPVVGVAGVEAALADRTLA